MGVERSGRDVTERRNRDKMTYFGHFPDTRRRQPGRYCRIASSVNPPLDCYSTNEPTSGSQRPLVGSELSLFN